MALRIRALNSWISRTGAISEVRGLDCFHLPVRLVRDLLLEEEEEEEEDILMFGCLFGGWDGGGQR